jgi:hypothetical protein
MKKKLLSTVCLTLLSALFFCNLHSQVITKFPEKFDPISPQNIDVTLKKFAKGITSQVHGTSLMANEEYIGQVQQISNSHYKSFKLS